MPAKDRRRSQQVDVHIDQPGQNGVARQIDQFGAGFGGDQPIADFRNLAIAHDDGRRPTRGFAGSVDQVTGVNPGHLGRRLRDG